MGTSNLLVLRMEPEMVKTILKVRLKENYSQLLMEILMGSSSENVTEYHLVHATERDLVVVMAAPKD